MQPIETIERIPLFAGLPAACKQRLASEARRRSYPSGATLALRGDEDGPMFAILTGTVKVHVSTEAGNEAVIALLGPGECVGELSVLDGAPRSADLTAAERTECLIFNRETILGLLKGSPDAALAIIETLCRRIRDNGALIESFATRDVVGRTAELLLRLAFSHAKSGKREAGGDHPVTIGLELTHSDIAACIGATRERVSFAVAELKRMKHIEQSNESRRLTITKPAKLREFVDQR